MKEISENKLLFLGMEEEDEYMYVVINETEYTKQYHFFDMFDDAFNYYNKINRGQYLKLYKIGYNYYNFCMKNRTYECD